MSLQHKIERTTVRTLMKMPGALAGRLAGMVESVSREGLDPKLRLLLALGDGRKGFTSCRWPRAAPSTGT